ncbi:MAG TPA: ABC transporter permease, partial [Ruminococcus flavefaciens]|nr:ABC transporter permease [Ruminococcus flavefaciens]
MIEAIRSQIVQLKKHKFLFEELVKRDFKKKYKRTVLGMLWSLISPLMQLLVMSVVFTHFFGQHKPHYTIYLFAGNLTYSFFKDSTNGGMNSLMQNAGIITKINLPKYMFLLSKNVASLINFGLTLIIFLVFAAVDGVVFHFRFLMLLYPIVCLIIFNI